MNKQAIAVIGAGFLTVAIAFSVRYAYGMLLPKMLPDFGISKTEAGAVFAVYFIVYTLSTPALGALSDRYSYRVLMSVFTMIVGCGACLMAYADSLLQAGLFFSVAALGHAACWAPVVAVVQKWVPDAKRGTALAFVSTGVGAGIFLWGLLLPVVVSYSGWRSGWFALGLTGIGIGVLNFLLVRNPKPDSLTNASVRPKRVGFFNSYRAIFRQGVFWLVGAAYFLVGYNVVTIFTFLPVYVREYLMMPYAVSTRFISVIALFGIGGQLLLGSLSDRVGRPRIMLVCGLIMGSAAGGLLWFDGIWSLYLLTAFYGIGYGAVWPVYAAAASDLFPPSNTGGIVGLWTVFLGVGSILAPVISGWIVDQTGQYTGVFLSALLTGVLSAVLLAGMPASKTIRQPATPE